MRNNAERISEQSVDRALVRSARTTPGRVERMQGGRIWCGKWLILRGRFGAGPYIAGPYTTTLYTTVSE